MLRVAVREDEGVNRVAVTVAVRERGRSIGVSLPDQVAVGVPDGERVPVRVGVAPSDRLLVPVRVRVAVASEVPVAVTE